MKSLLRVSAGLLLVALWVPAAPAQSPAEARPANELTLAGLRPGKDNLGAAEKKFGHKAEAGDEGLMLWADPCTGQSLRVEVDEQGVIQIVSVSGLGHTTPDCRPAPAKPAKKTRARATAPRLSTGRGLALGQTRKRVVELYGEPASELPATFEGREFALLFYAFDRAGSDVPQVMEVTCERESGRVRKITLAFPSL